MQGKGGSLYDNLLQSKGGSLYDNPLQSKGDSLYDFPLQGRWIVWYEYPFVEGKVDCIVTLIMEQAKMLENVRNYDCFCFSIV